MILTIPEILEAYRTGCISRGKAMQWLGIEWYGDLLQLLPEHGIPRPRASDHDYALMTKSVDEVFGHIKDK